MQKIMPETDDRTFVVNVSELLNREDYENIFISQLNRRLNKTGLQDHLQHTETVPA